MKKCVKCGKESTGNFCVVCGGELVDYEKDKKDVNEKVKGEEVKKEDNSCKEIDNINCKNNKYFIYIVIILIVAIVAMGIYTIYTKVTLENEISSLERRITKINKEKSELNKQKNEYLNEKINYKEKADFLDKNIVFVLDGYGNYYYTYDQVQQVRQGKSFVYWAYNREAAIGRGYRAWD